MPLLSGSDGDLHPSAVIRKHLDAPHLDVQHKGVHVSVEQHVASSTQHQQLQAAFAGPVQGCTKGIHRLHLGKPSGLRLDAKRGVLREFDVLAQLKCLRIRRAHVAISMLPPCLERLGLNSFPRAIVGNHVQDPLPVRPRGGDDVVAHGGGSQRIALPKAIRTLNGVHVLRSGQLKVHGVLHWTKLPQFRVSNGRIHGSFSQPQR